MLSQPSLKLYMSRGIQTDLTLVTQPSCSCNAPSKQLNSVVNCEPPTPGLESPSKLSHGQLESSILVCEGAYTQYSRTSNVPKLGPSCQKQKPSSIGYHRLIDDLTPSRRLVSLPSSGPQAEIPLERKLRIVSMPEVGKDGILMSSSMQNNLSSASDASHNSSPKEVMNHIHTYPSDLPRTPSPPSSPDSVMIIGNDSTQVSTSFLRDSYTDDDGKFGLSLFWSFQIYSAQAGLRGQVLPRDQSLPCMAPFLFLMPDVHRKETMNILEHG